MSYPRGHVKGLVHGVVKSVPHVVGKKSVDPIAVSVYSKTGTYWDLTEAAGTSRLDSTGGTANMTQYSSTGTAGNIGTNTGPRGGADVAIEFTGNNSKLATPHQAKIQSAAVYCLFGWFYVPANSGIQYLVFKWNNIDYISMQYVVALTTGPIIQCYNTGLSAYNTVNVAAPPANTWHFVCMWRDDVDGKLRMSMDGGATIVSATVGVPATSGHALCFGAGGGGGIPGNPNGNPFIGRMSRWGFCRDAFLTSDEVAWMINGGNGRNWAEIKTLSGH